MKITRQQMTTQLQLQLQLKNEFLELNTKWDVICICTDVYELIDV